MKSKKIYLFLLIGFHIGLGILSASSSLVARTWAIISLILGLYYILKNKNRNNEAILWTAYYASLEVFLRVTNGVIGYEMGKYTAITFLLLGQFLNHNNIKKNSIWLVFVIMMVPGIFITNWTVPDIGETVRATISGPLLIAIGAYYFSGRNIEWGDFKKILRVIILPLLSLSIVLTIKTPDFSKINFRSASNFATSGGFSPVHISAVLGIGILILFICILFKEKIFISIWVDLSILSILLLRTLLSFSRSGLFSAAIALVIIFLTALDRQNIQLLKKQLFFIGVIIFIVFGTLWTQVNELTGGMAYNRFTGRNTLGEKLPDVSTNRSALVLEDIQMFLNNPVFGIGVGMTREIRESVFNNATSSHTEYSRLPAEHGILGIGLLLILVLTPVFYYKKTSSYTKLFFVLFISYALLIMFPAATRTSLPLFIYGLAFIKISREQINTI